MCWLPKELVDVLQSDLEYVDQMSLSEALDYIALNYDAPQFEGLFQIYTPTGGDDGKRTMTLGKRARLHRLALLGYPLRRVKAGNFVRNAAAGLH